MVVGKAAEEVLYFIGFSIAVTEGSWDGAASTLGKVDSVGLSK